MFRTTWLKKQSAAINKARLCSRLRGPSPNSRGHDDGGERGQRDGGSARC